MTTGNIRKAQPNDLSGIYEFCCSVELDNDPKRMRKRGFLMAKFSQHPEIRDMLSKNIEEDQFYVSCENEKITGLLLGYNKGQFLEQRGGLANPDGGKIEWYDKALESLGILDINSIPNFAFVDKIARDPKSIKNGIAQRLLREFVNAPEQEGVNLIMSEIVEGVYDGNMSLNIKNWPSIAFYKKLGGRKVGESGKYSFPLSFLGDRGQFKDGIYMLARDRMPYGLNHR
jgi:ribosomal protein S18 acetylase RimI-like enzyme